jgi:hypothetical protein
MRLGIPLEPVREEWDKRSAILEYDAGIPRADAERSAMVLVTRYFEAQAARRIGGPLELTR